ncbi:hypothetical protein [[Clostridium] innocuum]|uniref:hypothetical protein n=1 Tax=Clostridium innocuum TaxID=1522 RepID=UPI001AFC088A|nr:hypothetical protein [[Clostridium] innocuum]QSI27796.1 hypothetical protein GKZ87_20965 [Erysipelotrichaceae bacterium 66202529]DAU14231.1 MAG TPA: hypothetical protein [Caudoviricetes sp.]MCC2832094.1 hypothetical protein [[Clostridium] innocuum]MCR0247020.1 hypothetical protein [[Clostridium] innocuum]MCR0258382.1 hypothetical protein [[Clostridium] innocuum]
MKDKNLFTKLIDLFRKARIFKFAELIGCDRDGDVITYKGTTYYINIFYNKLVRVTGERS